MNLHVIQFPIRKRIDMDIFDPICDDDDNVEYIGWGDGNSVGYGTGRPDGYHPIPKCETFSLVTNGKKMDVVLV